MMRCTRLRTASVHAVLVIAFSSAALPPRLAAAQQSGDADRPVLRVPETGSRPEIDGKLDEPFWKRAARTRPLKRVDGKLANSMTEAFVARDAEHLYVGVACGVNKAAGAKAAPDNVPGKEKLELLVDSNGDRNSFYLVTITPTTRKQERWPPPGEYREHWPPWQDLWRLQYTSVVAEGENGWMAEVSIPFNSLHRNRALTPEIGFNIRRCDSRGEVQCWTWPKKGAGTVVRSTLRAVPATVPDPFLDPRDAGTLRGMPSRSFPLVQYQNEVDPKERRVKSYRRSLFNLPPTEIATQEPIRLAPGSAHPGTTGEVRIELEGYLLGGDHHARAAIWDLAVDDKTGELYVLSVPRIKSYSELRVYDRQGRYLRTVMPFDPTLPSADVKDLCRNTAVEDGVELVMPKVFQIQCQCEFSLYGEWWNLPQKMLLAPNGDLIMSGIYLGTLWRMRPDGSLPREGWTSIYNSGRNEPFETACWISGGGYGAWMGGRWVKRYVPGVSTSYSYMCFDDDGRLVISDGAGVGATLTRQLGREFEFNVAGKGPAGSAVRKFRLGEGVRIEHARDFRYNGVEQLGEARNGLGVPGNPGEADTQFNGPCGLAVDGDHLIVADSGNNRIRVFQSSGRLAATVRHYEHEGKRVPLRWPTALTVDGGSLYVLVQEAARGPRRLLRLKSWRTPELLAISEPLHVETHQIAVDAGVAPPLVWVANGAGPGTLLQLAGDDLSQKGQWGSSEVVPTWTSWGNDEKLSNPDQYGGHPILNIDPETGHVYVEDDSHYRHRMHGTVLRIDQSGQILKKWPPVFYHANGKHQSDQYGIPDLDRHTRCPEEIPFIDCLFGKDGKIYRWQLTKDEISILRFDRAGKPVPFEATGSNALMLEPTQWNGSNRHKIYRGMDVDKLGNIYVANKTAVDQYGPDGNLKTKGLRQVNVPRGVLIDKRGDIYVLYEGPDFRLCVTKFPKSGGKPLWTRHWPGVEGHGGISDYYCMCRTSRIHQALDGKGYLYLACKFTVQVIDCETGRLVGEFGSYGNADCLGHRSAHPHPELPFGTISALAVWKDKLFVVDVLNRRIAKCRIIYDPAKRKTRFDFEDQ